MEKPTIVTKNDLVTYLDMSIERINKIKITTDHLEDPTIIEGLFVLAISSFENSIYDTLKAFLIAFPCKLDQKVEKLEKADLISGDPLKKNIEQKINQLAYRNLKEILDYFCRTISINQISDDLFYNLQEIKATRNLLIHGNLVVNDQYINNAGPDKRADRIGTKLQINREYLSKSIKILENILSDYKTAINEQYKNYTRIRAFKALWKFMLPTPIMAFEKEWEVNEEQDLVVRYNEKSNRKYNLSSSEKIIHNIWLSHFEGKGISTELSFYSLDEKNRQKMGYFLSVLDLLRKNKKSGENSPLFSE